MPVSLTCNLLLSALAGSQPSTCWPSYLRTAEMGLTQPGAVLSALARRRRDPAGRASSRPRRDYGRSPRCPRPFGQLLTPAAWNAYISSPGPLSQSAVELCACRRRTAELCSLRFACLDYDEHTDRRRRAGPARCSCTTCPRSSRPLRLPIHTGKRHHLRPAAGSRRLPPRPHRRLRCSLAAEEPRRTSRSRASHLQRSCGPGSIALPRLDALAGAALPVPFPASCLPLPFRHSFAQRHAIRPRYTLKSYSVTHGPHHALVLPGHRSTQTSRPGLLSIRYRSTPAGTRSAPVLTP